MQEKHPSALTWFEAALGAAKGKQIVMFLDYDGTLSPIVEDPDRAVMSEEVSNFFIFSPSRRRRRFLFLLLSSSGIKAEYPQFPLPVLTALNLMTRRPSQ